MLFFIVPGRLFQTVVALGENYLLLSNFERRGVRISEVMGRVIFWRRMMKKMTQKTATVTSPEVHLPDAPCGGP